MFLYCGNWVSHLQDRKGKRRQLKYITIYYVHELFVIFNFLDYPITLIFPPFYIAVPRG